MQIKVNDSWYRVRRDDSNDTIYIEHDNNVRWSGQTREELLENLKDQFGTITVTEGDRIFEI